MTTRTLTGTITTGYSLSPAYSALLVTANSSVTGVNGANQTGGSNGGAGGVGVYLAPQTLGRTVTNAGTINGGAGGQGYNGGAGGAGLSIAGLGSVANSGSINGGAGGAGAGANGGAGGVGVYIAGGGSLHNSGAISGGVGGSGTGGAAVNGIGRTAGQILLLKTAKKLGSILNDPVAGEAIHRELRGLIGKQEALKQKEMRDEATRQRFNQMQRKPWLTARAQQ